jgi:glucose/arabinose dehydrogenase
MTTRHIEAGARPRPALVALACTVWACGDGGGDLQDNNPPAVAEVTVEAAATTIAAGDSVQLQAVALDADGNALEDRTAEWASASPDVATVSAAGMVTGRSAGEARISATVEAVSGTIAITVSSTEPPRPPPPPPPPPPGTGTPGLEQIASGLAFPLGLTSPPGDERLFVVEKGGTIHIIQDGAVLPDPFLDISGQVSGRAEQGLLGLAFFPDYTSSGRFVVHYTDLQGDTQISVFNVSSDPSRADAASETPILSVSQPGPAHNGGQILFGPDGLLYIGLGDGGSRAGEDDGRGQSLGDLLGSVLRIDVSAGSAYSVPGDNPFVGTAGAQPEIWSHGLRNPWRFSFDRATGDLYIADVGETGWEEVDRARTADGAGRGVNYGWSVMEGPECLRDGCDRTGLTLPTLAYGHAEGCSIVGGYVYRGTALASLQGQYLFGDFCQGWVKSFAARDESPEPVDQPALSPGENITSFGEDDAGELYILTASGSVFKIVPR